MDAMCCDDSAQVSAKLTRVEGDSTNSVHDISVDGNIDDTVPERLHLSSETDFDRVDQVHDAILIGAKIPRRDRPA
jgi:hypothetical protein